MGTEKRERQKAGRAARVEAAREAERKAATRRKVTMWGGLAVVFAVLIGAYLVFSSDDDAEIATDGDTAVGSVAGEDCVALADELPEGAPQVDVPVGPPPTELVIEDLIEGEGDPVPADPATSVTVNYIGVACSTGVVFDSSWARGEPATFPLSGVIAGWTEGIPGMAPGGQRQLVIPPDMAYGAAGSPPDIAPDETLIFVVDLVEVADG